MVTMTHDIPNATLAGGARLPVLGFGTWQLTGAQAHEAVGIALELGYRHLDTATMYGNEDQVGRAVRESGLPREEVFITTKLPSNRFGQARQTLEQSLRNLGTDHLDLWLIHWPPGRSAEVDTWRRLLAARDEGLVKTVGVSNYSIRQLDELHKVTGEMPAVNQIPWSVEDHDPAVLAEHEERGVVVEGYSVLKKTNLRDPVLKEIAAAHGVTVSQVVLRWHLEHDIVMIPKSAHRARIAENLDLFGFSLTPDEVARIDALG
jgi:diketogulonate reductase-like aldo/keto reductase